MFTIFGSTGFIGSRLVNRLQRDGVACYCPSRADGIPGGNLGNVIYCIGLTADFRTKPFETVEAHVCHLANILRSCEFDSFMYLSSTRVYGFRGTVATENDVLQVEPLVADDLYNISKIMGESICFSSGRNVRVVRLSNVYGYDRKSENFVFTIIRDALSNNRIVLNTALGSSKDHINVDDVASILPKIALNGKYNLYNIANGSNVTVGNITGKIQELTGCDIVLNKDVRTIRAPRIDINRVRGEFDFKPTGILDDLEPIIEDYRKREGVK